MNDLKNAKILSLISVFIVMSIIFIEISFHSLCNDENRSYIYSKCVDMCDIRACNFRYKCNC